VVVKGRDAIEKENLGGMLLLFARAVALCLLAIGASGCRSDRVILIDHWRVQVEGAGDARDVRVPVDLSAELPSRPSHYRLTADVAIPESMQRETLTLAIPFLMAPIALRADGREVAPLDQDVWEGYRGRPSHRWRLAPVSESTLRLELIVEHGSGLSSRVDSVPRLSASQQGDSVFLWLTLFHRGAAFLAAATILLGSLYVFLFLLDRRRKSHAWFGIGTILASYYGLFFTGVTQTLLGTYEAAVLVITAVFALLCGAIYFLHTHFDLGRPPRAFLIGATTVSVLSIVFRDPFVILRVAPLIIIFSHAVIAYAIVTLLRLRRRRPPPLNVGVVLASWVVIIVAAWSDMMVFSGHAEIVGSIHTGCLGIVLYAVLQMVALSHEHTARIRHIELLNWELKRQLRGRTRELAQAFNLLGSRSREPSDPREGELIGGRYRIDRCLGRGNLGVVYRVNRISDGIPLALKVLDGLRDIAPARLAREAEPFTTLDHPNIVPVFDFGVARGGETFVVMELVRGTTLEAWRSSDNEPPSEARPPTLPLAMTILLQISLGLEAIHARGVVHGYLKPTNVLLSQPPDLPEAIARITDFGLSGLIEPGRGASGSVTRTAAGRTAAASRYRAPEVRASGGRATPASDMFSLGLLAYELLSGGHRPERRISLVGICPKASPEFLRIVDSCLGADPAERPTARAFASAATEHLAPLAEARGT
jgi:Protein kinase domain